MPTSHRTSTQRPSPTNKRVWPLPLPIHLPATDLIPAIPNIKGHPAHLSRIHKHHHALHGGVYNAQRLLVVIRIDGDPAHAVEGVVQAAGGDGDVAEGAERGVDGVEGGGEGGLDEGGHGAGEGFEGADDDEDVCVGDADGAGDRVVGAGAGGGGAGEEAEGVSGVVGVW